MGQKLLLLLLRLPSDDDDDDDSDDDDDGSFESQIERENVRVRKDVKKNHRHEHIYAVTAVGVGVQQQTNKSLEEEGLKRATALGIGPVNTLHVRHCENRFEYVTHEPCVHACVRKRTTNNFERAQSNVMLNPHTAILCNYLIVSDAERKKERNNSRVAPTLSFPSHQCDRILFLFIFLKRTNLRPSFLFFPFF